MSRTPMGRSAIWLGIDLGTQSVRAVAVAADGRVAGHGSCELQDERQGNRHEQDPENWWKATRTAVSQTMEQAQGCDLRGLAVDGTSGTLLLADSEGRPRTPGLMYDDARAGELANQVNDAGSEVWQSLGYRMQPSWALPRLMWLAQHQPDLFSGSRLLTQVDFITWRLAGKQTPSDSSNSLKTGYDLLHERWPVEVVARLGIPVEILPEVVRPGTRLGEVGHAAAAVTGIPQGTPIFGGMTDGCAAQLAAGAVKAGSWNSVLGTTLVLKGVTADLVHDPNGVVYSHRSSDGNWLPGGASSTGAGVLTAKFGGRNLSELDRAAQSYEPSSVITYPLAGKGERFPFVAPVAHGFTLGEPQGEADYFASLLQGVAFLERLSFDYLHSIGAPVDGELTFTGGGVKSHYWTQLRADVLGRSVSLPENAEPAAGMALLAAAGERPIAEIAREMIRIRETIDPRPQRTARFIHPYLRFVRELAARGWISRETLSCCEARAAA